MTLMARKQFPWKTIRKMSTTGKHREENNLQYECISEISIANKWWPSMFSALVGHFVAQTNFGL